LNIESMLANKIQKVDKLLKNYLTPNSEYEEKIYEAMKYSIFAGGKRIRPILMIEAYNVLNNYEKAVEPFAVAIEMIHTYSLIHDDLPAMDDDDYRRGKLTNHKVYGDGIAILAGDALLNLAFEIMIEGSLQNDMKLGLQAMKILGERSGVHGMIGGQVIDLLSENREISIETVTYIHEHKTAALIHAAVEVGVLLAGGTKEQLEKMKKFGYYLGMAFQIQDDILDKIGKQEILGKSIDSDEKNKKATYVSFYGLEKSKEQVILLSKKAFECLNYFGESADFLKQLTKYLMDRNY